MTSQVVSADDVQTGALATSVSATPDKRVSNQQQQSATVIKHNTTRFTFQRVFGRKNRLHSSTDLPTLQAKSLSLYREQ